MNRLSRINPYIWVGLIILLAAAARAYHITYPLNDMHSFRQTQTAGLIRDYFRQGIDLLYPTMITLGEPGYVILEFPLYQALAALFYKLFSPDIITARIFSILCGLLSILFVYRLTAKFLDERSALFASFFYAFMPLNIFFQRVPMPDPLSILLSLMMLDFMIEGINNRKNSSLIGGILAGGLGLMMKSPYTAPLYLPLFYAVYRHTRRWRSLLDVRVLAALFIPAACMLLWQWHANTVNELSFNQPGYPFKALYKDIMVKLYPVNKWYFGTIEQRLALRNHLTILARVYNEMLSLPGLISLIIGVAAVIKRSAFFYVIWLLAVVLSIMTFFNLHVVHNYYQLVLTPVLAVFCGAGASCLTGIFRQRVPGFLCAAVLTISFLYLHSQTMGSLYREENNYLETGSSIDRHTDENALVAISVPDPDVWNPTVMYYADRHGFMVPHRRLNGDMLEYLRNRRVQYLALIDYRGTDSGINKTLCPYVAISEDNRTTIYDIRHGRQRCKTDGNRTEPSRR